MIDDGLHQKRRQQTDRLTGDTVGPYWVDPGGNHVVIS